MARKILPAKSAQMPTMTRTATIATPQTDKKELNHSIQPFYLFVKKHPFRSAFFYDFGWLRFLYSR